MTSRLLAASAPAVFSSVMLTGTTVAFTPWRPRTAPVAGKLTSTSEYKVGKHCGGICHKTLTLSWPNSSNFCLHLDTPGPVDGPIRFTGITAEKCTVWWNPPENDGCAAITHYVVEKRETSRISWALASSKCEACSFNAANLIKGNEYQFRISAVNKFGVGKPLDSDAIIAQMQYSEKSYFLKY